MAAKALPMVNKFYRMHKPDIFTRGVPSRLPEAYRKFFEEWNAPKSAVHYQPEPGKWKRNSLTGEVEDKPQNLNEYAESGIYKIKCNDCPMHYIGKLQDHLGNLQRWPVQNVPIEVRYPNEANTGIWGGEGVIVGFREIGKHKYPLYQSVTQWWVPKLRRTVVYSEILDTRLSVIVTKRTINLIFDHHGFDNYILETSASDLGSLLALKLRKKMLLTLFEKTLYPDDPLKQEKVYNKYKHHLDHYNKEDLEWYALSIGEAVSKLQIMEDAVQQKPLKQQFRAELIEELKAIAAEELENILKGEPKEYKSWMNRINPFAKKD